MEQLKQSQKEVCRKYGAEFVEVKMDDIVGVAKNFGSGLRPLNGLRHPSTSTTSGWYLWAGEEFSDDPDFFEPIHMQHLLEQNLDIVKYLSLAPGWRFLTDPNADYEDVWFDKELTRIDSEVTE